jgi:type IV pilus assembly protein PilA
VKPKSGKLKGMASVEIAIIAAVLLIVAVAVAWYLYTTFVASITANPQMNILSAMGYQGNNSVRLEILNPGPIAIRVTQVEVAGAMITLSTPIDIAVGQRRVVSVTVPTSIATLTAGTMITGRVILSGGYSFPFSASVRP